jgi:hypothetical protein
MPGAAPAIRVEPMSTMRQKIAEHMVMSKRTSAHVATVFEIDMTRIDQLRHNEKVKEAIKNHHVLVGMNREMVMYAKGRPPKKVREHEEDVEFEEWIYGEPPQDVEFVRFVGDEVVKLETMKVDGTKMVKVDKEISLEPVTKIAKDEDAVTRSDVDVQARKRTSPLEQSSTVDPVLLLALDHDHGR